MCPSKPKTLSGRREGVRVGVIPCIGRTGGLASKNSQNATSHRASTKALADISRSALCCHSNETRAPIANPLTIAQLEGTPTIPPSYIRIRKVQCENAARDRHTDRLTHKRASPLYISHRRRLTRDVTTPMIFMSTARAR